MSADSSVRKFQQECFSNYIGTLQSKLPGFPKSYTYPDGNPIRPVLPVCTAINKIMIVGAFPSARFEMRDGKLIPVSDNLAPFGEEKYFDGQQIRIQESADRLYKEYFVPLGLNADDLWITDIVKIYLYPEKHIKNCQELFPSKTFVNTHKMFEDIANAGYEWFEKEMKTCKPKLIITPGEVAAKVITQSKKPLLDGQIRPLKDDSSCNIVHLVHPEHRRLNKEADEETAKQIRGLKSEIKKFI